MSLTYAEALCLQDDYAKTIKGLWFEIQQIGDEISTRIDHNDGIHYHFDTQFIFKHFIFKIMPLKAASRVGAIYHYGEPKPLASIKFKTISEYHSKVNTLTRNLAKKDNDGAIKYGEQLDLIDTFIRESIESNKHYNATWLEY